MSNHAPRRRLLALAAAVSLGTLLLAACSGSEDHDGRYSSLLRLVPDQPGFREGVTIVDYEAIRALPGFEASRPLGQTDEELANDPEALLKALGWQGIGGVPLEVLGFEHQYFEQGLPLLQEGFGIKLGDVDRSLTAAVVPPRYLYAVTGDLDPEDIEAHLDSCDRCADGERLEHRNEGYWSWGGEMTLAQRLVPPAFDQFGRGGNFRFEDGTVVRSNFIDDFEASIDASLGEGSLIDDEAYGLLAGRLDRHELVAIHIGNRLFDREFARQFVETVRDNSGGADPAFAWDIPADAVLPTAYEAFAIGIGVDGDEPYTLLLLAYPTAEEAEQNVDRLNERLATGLSESGETFSDRFTSTDISTDGRVLVATLRGQARFIIRFGIEPLLLHE